MTWSNLKSCILPSSFSSGALFQIPLEFVFRKAIFLCREKTESINSKTKCSLRRITLWSDDNQLSLSMSWVNTRRFFWENPYFDHLFKSAFFNLSSTEDILLLFWICSWFKNDIFFHFSSLTVQFLRAVLLKHFLSLFQTA